MLPYLVSYHLPALANGFVPPVSRADFATVEACLLSIHGCMFGMPVGSVAYVLTSDDESIIARFVRKRDSDGREIWSMEEVF